jgi:polygalacturonase
VIAMRVALPMLLLAAACGFDPRGAAVSDDGAVADGAELDGAVIDGAVIDAAAIDAA